MNYLALFSIFLIVSSIFTNVNSDHLGNITHAKRLSLITRYGNLAYQLNVNNTLRAKRWFRGSVNNNNINNGFGGFGNTNINNNNMGGGGFGGFANINNNNVNNGGFGFGGNTNINNNNF